MCVTLNAYISNLEFWGSIWTKTRINSLRKFGFPLVKTTTKSLNIAKRRKIGPKKPTIPTHRHNSPRVVSLEQQHRWYEKRKMHTCELWSITATAGAAVAFVVAAADSMTKYYENTNAIKKSVILTHCPLCRSLHQDIFTVGQTKAVIFLQSLQNKAATTVTTATHKNRKIFIE